MPSEPKVIDIVAETPPQKKGRPGRDYEALYRQWQEAGYPEKADWLRSMGLNPRTGTVISHTKKWLWQMAKDMGTAFVDRKENKKARKEKTIPTPPLPPEVDEETGEKIPPPSPKDDITPRGWHQIREWRRQQSAHDYKAADTVRQVCKMLLKESIVIKVLEDGTRDYRSTIKPNDLRAIMNTLTDVQRVQRLALGMSTENLGLESPVTDSNVEKAVDHTEEAIPVFVVEMSTRGKFLRPRPRKVG